MSYYQKFIATTAAKLGRVDIDPRHVEGYMRLQYGTLDHLDAATFDREVKIGIECVDADGIDNAESNAQSYAL